MQNSILGIGIFFVVLAFLVLAHVFIYKSFVDCFHISNKRLIFLMRALLIVMPFVFIATIAITRSNPNFVLIALYYLSGIWMGSLLIITVFFFFYFVIFAIISHFLSGLDYQGIGRYVIYFGLVVSLFSIYHATDIAVKRHSISSPNIPVSWIDKKVILASDIHLGVIHKESFLIKLIDKINAQNPDIVLITGDLFDGSRVDFSYLPNRLKTIKAQKGIFFINGNHDGYFGSETADKLLTEGGVKVLKDEVVDIDGLQVLGIDYMRGINIANRINSISKFNKDKYNILLYHEPIQIEQNIRAGIDLQLAGHTHFGQIFPIGYLTSILYGKYAYGLNKVGDANVYTTSGVGGWGPTMRFGTDSEIVEFTLSK